MSERLIEFKKSDYNSPMPNYASTNDGYSGMYATKMCTLQLPDSEYAYVEVKITTGMCGVSGHDGLIAFYNNGNIISVGMDMGQGTNTIYSSYTQGSTIHPNIVARKFDCAFIGTSTTTFYVVVNSDNQPKSDKLNVFVSYNYIPPETPLEYLYADLEFSCPNILHTYEMGLHVYSPYDASFYFNTPKLTTKLSSIESIENWDIGTIVYHDQLLTENAFPYYYGYGYYVYKVGDDYDRAFGIKYRYTVDKDQKLQTEAIGPQSFYDSTQKGTPSCIMPIMDTTGIIRKKILASSLSQPSKYLYYLGYSNVSKVTANNNVFGIYDFETEEYDPIIGITHALIRLYDVRISGLKKIVEELELNITNQYLDHLVQSIIDRRNDTYDTISYISYELGGVFYLIAVAMAASGCVPCGVIISPIFFELAFFAFLIGTLSQLIKWLFPYSQTFEEDNCLMFLDHYTTTPYIELGNKLYRDIDLTDLHAGYYCDGAYYYTQGATIPESLHITAKELSSATQVLKDDQGVKQSELAYSILPDNPVEVTDFLKLYFLPYTSGKPVPGSYGSPVFFNTDRTAYYNQPVGDLESISGVTYVISGDTIYSFESVADANQMADDKLSSILSIGQVQNYGVNPKYTEYGIINAFFTHELKIETTPTNILCYYDKRIYVEPITGTTFYYDIKGWTKSLTGYYAITGETFYRKFYYVESGVTQHTYIVQNSGDTTTTTFEVLVTDYLNYSSNWFLIYSDAREMNINFYPLFSGSTLELYSYSIFKKGIIKGLESLKLYEITGYTNAVEGFYFPMIPWTININNAPYTYGILYYTPKTILLDVEKDCRDNQSDITTRGCYIIGKVDELEAPIENILSLVIDVYTTGSTITYSGITTSVSSRSYFLFDEQISSSKVITDINITSITPTGSTILNSRTYEFGQYLACACNLSLDFETTNNTATVIVNNGVPNYRYYWSNDQVIYSDLNESTISGLTTGTTYTVIVVDDNNCAISGSTATLVYFEFEVRRNNTGECSGQSFSSVYSDSSILSEGIVVYDNYELTIYITQYTHLCDCVNNNEYIVGANGILNSPYPVTCP